MATTKFRSGRLSPGLGSTTIETLPSAASPGTNNSFPYPTVVDYCNILHIGLSLKTTCKVQIVQNTAAHILMVRASIAA